MLQAAPPSASDEDMAEQPASLLISTPGEDTADVLTYEPQFPDHPFDFDNLTPAQHTLADPLHQLNCLRSCYYLTHPPRPGPTRTSDYDPDGILIRTTAAATVAHLCTFCPGTTAAQMREMLGACEEEDLLVTMFGHFLGRLCGAETERAFGWLLRLEQEIVIELTEKYGVRALRRWQRGAEAGGVSGLMEEADGDWEEEDAEDRATRNMVLERTWRRGQAGKEGA
ncbi:hypothetical protein LTR86_004240 [Recurvomyces mirabilis]|nr:hypothetical protein LTR86_004240 [Recurvomyces mirabilis]